MGSKYVVTITRQFGSMGRLIAGKMSEKLQIGYYDRDIVEDTARKMNLPVSLISNEEERGDKKLFHHLFPLGMDNINIQDAIFRNQARLINELVEKESCIIVGRCSDYVLENHPNSLHIYIYAPYEARLDNCVKLLGEDTDTAKRMIADVDKARDAYHKRYAKYLPNDIDHKDILIDSSELGIDGTADLLTDMVKKRFKL